MPSIIQKASTAVKNGLGTIGELIRGSQKLESPDNVESQIQKSDLADFKTEDEINRYLYGDDADGPEKLINLGEQRYEAARLGREQMLCDFYTGIAFYQGEQRCIWNDATGMLTSGDGISPGLEDRFGHKNENIIKVMIKRAVSRICAAFPDAWVTPLTDSPQDQAAAQIGASVVTHCNQVTKLDKLIREAVGLFLKSTTCFYVPGWDAKAESDIGIPQPDGSIEYHKAPIGEITGHIRRAIDIYPDPNSVLSSKGIHGGAYVIEVGIYSTDYIKKKWGKDVDATCSDGGTYGFLEQKMEWISGNRSRSSSGNKNSAEVKQVYELPSDQFRKGRFWVYSGETFLHGGPWPYEKKDKYPFIPMYFEQAEGTIWGLNMVKDLLPTQKTLNLLATKMAAMLEWWAPSTFVPSTAGIASDDLESPEIGRVIPFTAPQVGGAIPVHNVPPGTPDWMFKMEAMLIAKAEFIAGVHDFNSDSATAVNSGTEFELRVMEDKNRLTPVIKHVSECVAEIQEWNLALYRQFGTALPRLLAIDSKSIKQGQGPATAQADLRALKDGNCRVILRPGSGESKLPAAEEEELQEMIKLMTANGGIPPPIMELYIELQQSIRPTANLERFKQAYAEWAAQQAAQKAPPPVLQIEEMKQKNAMDLLQAKAQADQQSLAAKAQADAAHAGIVAHTSSLENTWRMQATQADAREQANHALALEHQRFMNALTLAQANQVKYAVAAKLPLGPNAVRSAELHMGLTPDTPEYAEAMTLPVDDSANEKANKADEK